MIYMQLDENIVGSSSIAGGSEREFLLRRWSSVGVGTKSSSGLTFQSSRRPGSASSVTSSRSRLEMQLGVDPSMGVHRDRSMGAKCQWD